MTNKDPVFPRFPPGWDAGRNDLEGSVFEAHPIVGELKARLEKMGADLALMSGSGPTVFGWFRDVQRARHVARSIAGKGLYSRLTRTLGVEDHMF